MGPSGVPIKRFSFRETSRKTTKIKNAIFLHWHLAPVSLRDSSTASEHYLYKLVAVVAPQAAVSLDFPIFFPSSADQAGPWLATCNRLRGIRTERFRKFVLVPNVVVKPVIHIGISITGASGTIYGRQMQTVPSDAKCRIPSLPLNLTGMPPRFNQIHVRE